MSNAKGYIGILFGILFMGCVELDMESARIDAEGEGEEMRSLAEDHEHVDGAASPQLFRAASATESDDVAASTESVTPLSQACPAGHVCGYSLPSFEGTRTMFPCSHVGEIDGHAMRSARNRCGNKANYIKDGRDIVACMNPGGDRPNPGLFTSVKLGDPGSRCL